MPTAWFRHSVLRTAALLGGLILILSGCHHLHPRGHGYHSGGHHGGGYHRGYDRDRDGGGHHRGGWRRGHGRY